MFPFPSYLGCGCFELIWFHHSVASSLGLFQTQDVMTIYEDSVGYLKYEATGLPNGAAKSCPVSSEPTAFYDCGRASTSPWFTCVQNGPSFRTLAPRLGK